MNYIKIKIPCQVEFSTSSGFLESLEGNIKYEIGDALITGIQGEQWPIDRVKFEQTYQPIEPTKMGENGAYFKKRIVVEAQQKFSPFTITTNRQSLLSGKSGDWLVTSPDGSKWIVANSIFEETYQLVDDYYVNKES